MQILQVKLRESQDPLDDFFECTKRKFLTVLSEDDMVIVPTTQKITIRVQPHVLPEELAHITEAVENAKYILDLPDNWDDDGALKVPPYIFDRAIDFLNKYSERAHYIFNFVIQAPVIQPLNDGSIDLEWDTEKASLLINFKNSEKNIAFYYGDLVTENNQKFDFNGEIPTNTVEDTFISWLKNLS